MTSRVSFPKLLMETLRRHIAAVLITVLGFFIHIIGFFMNVQNIISAEYITAEYSVNELLSGNYITKIAPEELEYILQELAELCSPNLTNGIIALIFGAYLAFAFFRYMHSKRETDFYESLPIRRQTWFKTILVSCFALFFVLCAATTGIEIAIIFSTGYGSLSLLQSMLWNLICMTSAFLISWFTTALAMVMTGHPIIAFLGYGVFASYIPLILANLIPVYCQRFFDTYVYSDNSQIFYYFSPATLIYKMTNSWYDWKLDEHWTYLIGSLIFIIVIGIVTYLLFLRRPSEAAGRAMAFEKANSVIRFMLVIPLALYAGLFLDEMSTISSIAWLIFGVIFAAFLLHGIMECIFQFDIKAIISKKKQLLATIVVCLGFVCIFWADFLKYDEYIPDANDVKMVKMESHLFGYEDARDMERDWLQGDLVKDALTVAKEIRDSEVPSEDEYYYMDHITFTYVMKNGYEVKREYSYDASKASENLNKLFANQDFKDDYCVLYNIDRSNIVSLSIYNGMESMPLKLSEDEMNELIDNYLEEYSTLEFSQFLTETASYELIVEYQYDDHSAADYYYVYPSFTKTLAFLKEKGIVNFYESENITLTNMEIFDYYQNHKESYEYQSLYISDTNQLNELKQYMILNQFKNYIYSDEYLYAEVEVKLETGIDYISVYVKREDIDKVLKD